MTPPSDPVLPAGVELPDLVRPVGALEFPLRAVDPAGPLAVGRRAEVNGTDAGLDVRIDGNTVARGLRVRGAELEETRVTPVGAELVLDGVDGRMLQRVVASRDAPVVWLEWSALDGAPAPAIELEWRAESTGPTGEDTGGPPEWQTLGHGLGGRYGDAGSDGARRVIFVFSGNADVTVPSDATGPGVRVRLPGGETGARMAVVGAAPDDDLDRLLRVAGRTQVAARARAAAADRAMKEGLTLTVEEPASGTAEAVAWARLRLADAAALPHGPWTLEEAAATAEARLMAGDHAPVLALLKTLASLAVDGAAPTRGVGARAVEHHFTGTELLRGLLDAYLDWSGDPGGAGQVAQSAGFSDWGVDQARPEQDGAPEMEASEQAVPERGAPVGPPSPHTDPAGVIRWLVRRVLGVEPDASRGRLVLRPRPPAGWSGFEVHGLRVGTAEVALAYRRRGDRDRVTLRQLRGPAPLQVVLAPELLGRRVVRTTVDGQPADLDIRRMGDRWQVPVQLVPDQIRTLEVEFGGRPD